MPGDRAEFLQVIEQAMDKAWEDHHEDPVLIGLIRAVTYYTDTWRAEHDERTLAEYEREPDEPSRLGLTNIAGFRPDDAFTLQVLEEQMEVGERQFTRFRQRHGLEI